MKRRKIPRYLQQILAGPLPGPGAMVEVVVEHDDHCSHWRGRPCSCDPNIRIVTPAAGSRGKETRS